MNTTEEKGFDAEKKDLAIKCQIALNLQEFPYAIGITKNIKLLLSFKGAEIYARIEGVMSAVRKNQCNVFSELCTTFERYNFLTG